jgi:hypothetical protein
MQTCLILGLRKTGQWEIRPMYQLKLWVHIYEYTAPEYVMTDELCFSVNLSIYAYIH